MEVDKTSKSTKRRTMAQTNTSFKEAFMQYSRKILGDTITTWARRDLKGKETEHNSCAVHATFPEHNVSGAIDSSIERGDIL